MIFSHNEEKGFSYKNNNNNNKKRNRKNPPVPPPANISKQQWIYGPKAVNFWIKFGFCSPLQKFTPFFVREIEFPPIILYTYYLPAFFFREFSDSQQQLTAAEAEVVLSP